MSIKYCFSTDENNWIFEEKVSASDIWLGLERPEGGMFKISLWGCLVCTFRKILFHNSVEAVKEKEENLRCMLHCNLLSYLLNTDDDFVCVDGSTFDYHNWIEGQPDGDNRQCVKMTSNNAGKWDDLSCDESSHTFVCKTPKSKFGNYITNLIVAHLNQTN